MKKTRKFKNLNCSPLTRKKTKKSCYDNGMLNFMKTKWNEKEEEKITTNNPEKIWNFLKLKFLNNCDKESCWLSQDFLKLTEDKKKQLLFSYFSPKSPDIWKKNKTEWLSNIDIENVLKQYETAYPFYKSFGPSPIDYDYKFSKEMCVDNELCNFNIQYWINKGKKKLSVVFNTDKHTKSGSHWVSLFIDTTTFKIYYFDSVGNDIPKKINQFVQDIIKKDKRFELQKNYPFEHQYKNTECGVYTLYFILEMLKNKKSFNYFKTKRIPDNKMVQYRKIYFNEDL